MNNNLFFVYVIRLVAILIVLYIFEITKAVATTLQGDDTPKSRGMLTLNIFNYFEPVGFLLAFFFGYGWGQPAPVSVRAYKNRQTGTVVTYLSPIILSLVLAALLKFAAKAFSGAAYGSLSFVPALFAIQTAFVFEQIAIFNLIPIPPMCGYEILRSFLSPNAAFKYGQNAPLIQMGFLFLWFFGLITPILNNIVAVVDSLLTF